MARPKKIDPSVEKNISIPQSLCTRVDLILWSELEGKVPHGAWARYIEGLIRADLERKLRQQALATNLRDCRGGDVEMQHVRADELLSKELESLGYGEAVAVFNEMPKWYA